MQHPDIDAASLNRGLLEFLQASPTPFHAVRQMIRALEGAGYRRLYEHEAWNLAQSGLGKYYLTRNDSSVIAFDLGRAPLVEQGLRMLGAHTDSPCLKLKPLPDLTQRGYSQLGVEVYGGALLNPWFDRDLSIAGRVVFLDSSGEITECLIDFARPIAIIPSLAIHLDREVNAGRAINPQMHLPLLTGIAGDKPDWKQLLAQELKDQGHACQQVLDFELCCYDTQPPSLVGLSHDFIAAARLDNLLSCYIGLQALLRAEGSASAKMLVANDHEEVGSASTSGARGTFLRSVLERLAGEAQAFGRLISRSMLISVDNAHGVHPNYADKHDANHGPLLNKGPVIKVNAEQRYASNSQTAALFRHLCEQARVPVQSFVVRSDMACGSTIGPITASEIGVATLDIGVPTFAMHSIRELVGSQDPAYLLAALQQFLQLQQVPLNSCV